MFDYEKFLIGLGQIIEKEIHKEIGELKAEMNRGFEQVNNEFALAREEMNQGFKRIDQRFEEVDQRFEEVNNEITLMKEDMQNGFDALKTAAKTSNSYHKDIKPRVDRLERSHELLVGRINLLEG